MKYNSRKIIFLIVLFVFLIVNQSLNAQVIKKDTTHFNAGKFCLFTGGSLVVYGGCLIWLNEQWFAGYPHSSFHFTNDMDEWMQMDKFGHCFTAYHESMIGMEGLKWSGVSRKKAILYGSLWGVVFQAVIEVMDGLSEPWGFSAGDISANMLGSAFAVGQQLTFKEQKILYKWSFHETEFASKNPDALGNTLASQMLKDYNGHSYWFSFSPGSFRGLKKVFPEWLCISLGYGAEGMVDGEQNPAPYSDINRYRQFFLSLDINTLKLRKKNKFMYVLLTAISAIKIPAPALEINTDSGNNIKFHYFYF